MPQSTLPPSRHPRQSATRRRRIAICLLAASTGATFMDETTRASFTSTLAPLATLLTPNLNEAARLLKVPAARDLNDMRAQAEELSRRLSVNAVLLKGGHLESGADAAS